MRIIIDPSRPIYQQIIDEVKRALARGDLRPGDKLPSHRDLAEESKVNPNTVQHAYGEMERQRIVETLRGQGTFIRNDPALVGRIRDEMASQAVLSFLADMESLGYSAEEIVASVTRALSQHRAPHLTNEEAGPASAGVDKNAKTNLDASAGRTSSPEPPSQARATGDGLQDCEHGATDGTDTRDEVS